MIVSDAPSCSVTYNCHYDDRNSFIIQATVVVFIRLHSLNNLPTGPKS